MPQQIPKGYFANNIDAVGYHDLNGKPAFKLALQEKNHRWYLYVAHLWHRGWSVLDVSDPAHPRQLASRAPEGTRRSGAPGARTTGGPVPATPRRGP